MLFLIILLTVAMVIDCIALVFLVLMQLPKKEAGAGLAFGGAATDALFGAGSGNFLTKATKYSAGIFFALALVLSILQSRRAHQPGSDFLERLKQHQNEQPTIVPPPATPTPPPAASAPPPIVPATTNFLLRPDNSAPSNAAPVAPSQK
ncbi:MAG TPA: preprotein translocase subunit SecG [Verrucomicrobiae bacterium]|jgi:preprotein translocase subunit SecG|nr:preprotein translocase subunit SecG [Verrucomicrobiae bacterium]